MKSGRIAECTTRRRERQCNRSRGAGAGLRAWGRWCTRTGTGVRNHTDRERLPATVHGPAVLQNECAALPVQRAADPLDGDVSGGALHRRAPGEQLAFARSDQVALKLFVDRESAQRRADIVMRRRRRNQLDLERAAGMGHDSLVRARPSLRNE